MEQGIMVGDRVVQDRQEVDDGGMEDEESKEAFINCGVVLRKQCGCRL
ncbi:MAG: hypothetical protein IJW91_04340 [Phascolarctobacterium sp.]|nr:hypothetical protein [Phascolarctobacterium sp.]